LLTYAQRGASVQQIVTIEVKPIAKLAVSGDPAAMVVTDADAGSEPVMVTDERTRYSMVTNLDAMKIVASIDRPMPRGTRLMVALGTSTGVSSGLVDISTASSPVTVVAGIGRGSDVNQPIRYAFAADATVGQLAAESRTITLTLTE
jgi:hypothetical protein